MVAIFVVLMFLGFILIDVIVQKFSRKNVKSHVQQEQQIFVTEVGLTMADGGKPIDKK